MLSLVNPGWVRTDMCSDAPNPVESMIPGALLGALLDCDINGRWFGAQDGFSAGEAETLARRRKAEALPARLGALYLEVAGMREAGRPDPARLRAIQRELGQYPEDWLLLREVGELLDPLPT